MSIGRLTTLPAETVDSILECLDARDLLRCRTVCRTLKEHVDESSAMQYIIRLAMCGYKHVHRRIPDTPASQLQQLEDHINRWKCLDWIKDRIPLPPNHGKGKLVGGVYAHSYHRDQENMITFIELPSRIRHSSLRKWSHEYDFKVWDFGLVPSDDLLAVVEIKLAPDQFAKLCLHLRSLSSNTAHPQAHIPLLIPNFDFESYPHLEFINPIQIGMMGDSLGLHYHDKNSPSHIRVWNWCTGDLLFQRKLAADIFFFILLGPKTLLLPGLDELTGHDSLMVYEFSDLITPVQEVVSLHLPIFEDPGGSGRLSGCDLFMTRDPPILNQMPFGGAPFDTSDVRILYFEGVVNSDLVPTGDDFWFEDHGEFGTFGLFIPLSSILRYAHHRPTTSVPWHEWSPQNSLLLRSSNHDSICRMGGSRFVYVKERTANGDIEGPPILTLLDFTPNAAAWPDSSQTSAAEEVVANQAGPSTEDCLDVFGTRLPFNRVERKIEIDTRYAQILVDDEHILLRTSIVARGNPCELFVFTF